MDLIALHCRVLHLACVLFLSPVVMVGQGNRSSGPAFPSYDRVPAPWSSLAPFVLPKVLQDGVLLKEYVLSEEFAAVRRAHGDVYAVDALFDRALRLSWNSVGEALLISAFACLDHRRVGIRAPFIGTLLWLPLTSEFPDEYEARVGALPSQLYEDTPPGAQGDRDKLQHFFGSAYLAYVCASREAAERFGNFVEWGEDRFVAGGMMDWRDERANDQGRSFGLWLRSEDTALPSQFLRQGHPHPPRIDMTHNDSTESS